jgi:hypothetical protein
MAAPGDHRPNYGVPLSHLGGAASSANARVLMLKVGHMFVEMMSEALALPSEVEWMWMVVPPMGMLEAPTLAFGLPLVAALDSAMAPTPVVILAPTTHSVEVSGGSWRHQRSPARHGQSPPHPSSPWRDR